MPLSLLALAFAAFGVGTSEFVVMGLLPDLATDLHVTIPRAGLIVTAYALGVTVGAPIVAIATARLHRKTALLGLMVLFTAGNLACAISPTYAALIAARIATSFCHGAFFGIASVVAASLVPRSQRSRAIAMVVGGLTIANILGVPFGTFLGQWLGWRATFWAIVPIGLISLAAIARFLPRADEPKAGSILREFGVLKRPQVLLAMTMSTLSSVSLFTVFTYVAPLLETETGLSPHQVAQVLLLFGCAITAGNFLGGRLADWRQLTALIMAFSTVSVLVGLLGVTLHSPLAMIVNIGLWGLAVFIPGAALQTRVVDQAHGAPNLASILNQGAFNLGNALGAGLGGLTLDAGYGYAMLPWVASVVGLGALGMAIVSLRTDRPLPVMHAGD